MGIETKGGQTITTLNKKSEDGIPVRIVSERGKKPVMSHKIQEGTGKYIPREDFEYKDSFPEYKKKELPKEPGVNLQGLSRYGKKFFNDGYSGEEFLLGEKKKDIKKKADL